MSKIYRRVYLWKFTRRHASHDARAVHINKPLVKKNYRKKVILIQKSNWKSDDKKIFYEIELVASGNQYRVRNRGSPVPKNYNLTFHENIY